MEQPQYAERPAIHRFLYGVLGIRHDELQAVAWSFLYFFCVLSSYFMLRSVREAMAIVSGVQTIPWLFTGTFVLMMMATPVFGWIASKYPRRTFLPWIYWFFVANILAFFGVFSYSLANDLSIAWTSRVFFVWLSVFNLFVVSVFWSFMADIYDKEQSHRLFGVISAGGSAGAILGPILTALLVTRIGFQNILPISAFVLSLGVFCIFKLRNWVQVRHERDNAAKTVESSKPLGGTAWAGLKFVLTTPYFRAIAIALACANFLGVVTYIYVADLVSTTFEGTDKQTQIYAILDTAVNATSFIGQLLIVRQVVKRAGVGWTLAILPIASVALFLALTIHPVFIVIAVLQVLRRSITFGLTKPTTDMLYVVVSPEEKYKAKNFIETAVYRAWDAIASWIVRGIGGLGLTGVAAVCIPIALAWTWLALWIGREYRRRESAMPKETAT